MKHVCLLAALAMLTGLAGAAEPDLTTPAMQALRADYLKRRAEIEQKRTAADVQSLEAQLGEAKQMQVRAKISGNITAQAAARAAVQTFEAALEEVRKTGSFTLPERSRRDLESMMAACRKQQQSNADACGASLHVAEGESGDRLREILAQQGTPIDDEAARKTLLATLAATAPPAPAGGPGSSTNAPTAGTNVVVAVEGATNDNVIASSGPAADWVVVARIEAEVNALEMLSIPLAGLAAPRTTEGEGPISAQPLRVSVQPERELVPAAGGAPLFRVRSVPGRWPVDVADWPTSRNGWTLEVRARPHNLPSRHAFTLEASAASVALRALAGATPADTNAAAAAAAPRVKVRFGSEPAGAYVSVGGSYLGRAGRALATPFEYDLPAVPCDIRFRKRGFREVAYANVTPRAGAQLFATLAADPNFAEEKVTVQAGARTWSATRVRVRPGQRVRIVAEGTWSCGEGGEPVDAAGYPNDGKFFKYYLDPVKHPRLVSGVNYGALLVRVGDSGEPQAVGRELELTPTAEASLSFDINEGAGERGNNRGALTVRVQTEPAPGAGR